MATKHINLKLQDIYFHELNFLCHVIRDSLARLFRAARPATSTPGNYAVKPRLARDAWNALSAAANVNRLLNDGPRKNNESLTRYGTRLARAKMLRAVLDGVALDEILKPDVRNRLDHFDEHLDKLNLEISATSTPTVLVFNMGMPTKDHVFSKSGPTYRIRIYAQDTKVFHHLDSEIDLGKVDFEARAIISRLRKRKLVPSDGTRALISCINFGKVHGGPEPGERVRLEPA